MLIDFEPPIEAKAIPMQKISQYLGHTTTGVTEHSYAHYSPSSKRDAAEALNW